MENYELHVWYTFVPRAGGPGRFHGHGAGPPTQTARLSSDSWSKALLCWIICSTTADAEVRRPALAVS